MGCRRDLARAPRPRERGPLSRAAEGVKAEEAFAKNGTLPDPKSTTNHEFQIVLGIIRRGLEAGLKDKWTKMAKKLVGVSEETTTGVKVRRGSLGGLAARPGPHAL